MDTTDGSNGVNGLTMDSMPSRSLSDHTLVSARSDREAVDVVNGMGVHVLNGHRLPSYVSISCAISGYSDYNHYCTRRHISVTQQPVNRLNDSFHRKNSLISEALITSRHNVNEDIDDVESNGTERSVNLANSDTNSEPNDKNSFLEQRIASLYGQTFAKDWRESRTKTRQKFNSSFIITKQRSPSCPPIHKTTANSTTCKLPTPVTTKSPPQRHANQENNKSDHPIDTHSKFPKRLPNCETKPQELVKQLEPQNNGSNDDNSQSIDNKSETETQVVSSDSLSCNDSQSPQTRPTSERDGNWFLSELNKTTQEIQHNIDLIEAMLIRQDSLMSEDMSGKLRAAVGKANLLINKKFKQFHELCLKNISQSSSEQFVTTNDDLQGFWDMMSIQVIDINHTFAQIHSLEATGWKGSDQDKHIYNTSDIPKKTTSTPTKSRSRKSTPKGSPVKACDESNTDRESERRNRLKEAKRKARLKASQTDDEITIFIPSKALNN